MIFFSSNKKKYHIISDPSQKLGLDDILNLFLKRCNKLHGVQYDREKLKKELCSLAFQKDMSQFIWFVICVYNIDPILLIHYILLLKRKEITMLAIYRVTPSQEILFFLKIIILYYIYGIITKDSHYMIGILHIM